MEPSGILALILWIWAFLAIKAGFIGMALLIQNARPEFIARVQEQYRRKPRKAANLVGLLNAVAQPFIGLLLVSTGILFPLGVAVLMFYLWLALLGFTVVYREIGERLFDELGTNADLKATLYGGLIAEAAFFTPVLGQLFSIGLFIKSLGAVTLTIFGRRDKN